MWIWALPNYDTAFALAGDGHSPAFMHVWPYPKILWIHSLSTQTTVFAYVAWLGLILRLCGCMQIGLDWYWPHSLVFIVIGPWGFVTVPPSFSLDWGSNQTSAVDVCRIFDVTGCFTAGLLIKEQIRCMVIQDLNMFLTSIYLQTVSPLTNENVWLCHIVVLYPLHGQKRGHPNIKQPASSQKHMCAVPI